MRYLLSEIFCLLTLVLLLGTNNVRAQTTIIYANISKEVNRDELVNQIKRQFDLNSNSRDEFVVFISSGDGVQFYDLKNAYSSTAVIDSLRSKLKEQYEHFSRDYRPEIEIINAYLLKHNFVQNIAYFNEDKELDKEVKLIFFLNPDGVDSKFEQLQEAFIQKLLLSNRLVNQNGLVNNLELEIYSDLELIKN